MSVCTGEQRTAADNLTAPGKNPGHSILVVYVPLVASRFVAALNIECKNKDFLDATRY